MKKGLGAAHFQANNLHCQCFRKRCLTSTNRFTDVGVQGASTRRRRLHFSHRWRLKMAERDVGRPFVNKIRSLRTMFSTSVEPRHPFRKLRSGIRRSTSDNDQIL